MFSNVSLLIELSCTNLKFLNVSLCLFPTNSRFTLEPLIVFITLADIILILYCRSCAAVSLPHASQFIQWLLYCTESKTLLVTSMT